MPQSPLASPLPHQQLPVSSSTDPTPAASRAPTAAGDTKDMLHQQAAPDQNSVAEASGPSSISPSACSPSSPSSSSPASASTLSSSSSDGSQPALPLQPASSRQSDAHAHGQTRVFSDPSPPQNTPGSAKSTTKSASDSSFVTAETDLQAIPTAAAVAAATQATSAVSSSVKAARDSNDTSLSASSDAMHSEEELAGLSVGSRGRAAAGLPSSCAGCFSACVETCATTGLGLDALNTALLELANASSLASGALCKPSIAVSGFEAAQTTPLQSSLSMSTWCLSYPTLLTVLTVR